MSHHPNNQDGYRPEQPPQVFVPIYSPPPPEPPPSPSWFTLGSDSGSTQATDGSSIFCSSPVYPSAGTSDNNSSYGQASLSSPATGSAGHAQGRPGQIPLWMWVIPTVGIFFGLSVLLLVPKSRTQQSTKAERTRNVTEEKIAAKGESNLPKIDRGAEVGRNGNWSPINLPDLEQRTAAAKRIYAEELIPARDLAGLQKSSKLFGDQLLLPYTWVQAMTVAGRTSGDYTEPHEVLTRAEDQFPAFLLFLSDHFELEEAHKTHWNETEFLEVQRPAFVRTWIALRKLVQTESGHPFRDPFYVTQDEASRKRADFAYELTFLSPGRNAKVRAWREVFDRELKKMREEAGQPARR